MQPPVHLRDVPNNDNNDNNDDQESPQPPSEHPHAIVQALGTWLAKNAEDMAEIMRKLDKLQTDAENLTGVLERLTVLVASVDTKVDVVADGLGAGGLVRGLNASVEGLQRDVVVGQESVAEVKGVEDGKGERDADMVE